jgi:hypothetical protein
LGNSPPLAKTALASRSFGLISNIRNGSRARVKITSKERINVSDIAAEGVERTLSGLPNGD